MNTPFKLKTSAPNTNRLQPFELFAPHCLDSYKLGHKDMYPELTEYIYSTFTARADKHLNLPQGYNDHKFVVWGALGALKDMVALWDRTFFSRPKAEVLMKYNLRTPAFTGKPATLDHLAALHDLGYLPLRVKMLPEGSYVNIRVPFLTIVNTDKRFYWLTNALETHISNEMWKPITTATIAYAYRRMLDEYAEKTGSPKDFVPWQGHDFADRGMSGMMDAAKSGGGHSLSFWGSDSVSCFDWLAHMYQGDLTFMGGSVPATEHSVMTIKGIEGEFEVIKRIISEVVPDGVVSFVADGFDFWKVITEYAPALKDVILARKENALGLSKVVFRPDSGDPVKILTGLDVVEVDDLYNGVLELENKGFPDVIKYQGKFYDYEEDFDNLVLRKEVPEHVVKGAVHCLWDTFGGVVTDKGYKLLSPRVGLIYGDSITPERCLQILQRLEAKGFASGNVVLGIGSYTYQYITRDTLGMAIKAVWGMIDGQGYEIFKDPKTDDGLKKSAKGLVKVLKAEEANAKGGISEKYILVDQVNWDEEDTGELELVFENGNFLVEPSLEEARNRLAAAKP